MLISTLSSAALSHFIQSPLGFNGGALMGATHYILTHSVQKLFPLKLQPYISAPISKFSISSVISHLAFAILSSYGTSLLLGAAGLPPLEVVEIMSFAFTYLVVQYADHYGSLIIKQLVCSVASVVKKPSTLRHLF